MKILYLEKKFSSEHFQNSQPVYIIKNVIYESVYYYNFLSKKFFFF